MAGRAFASLAQGIAHTDLIAILGNTLFIPLMNDVTRTNDS